MKEGKNLRVIMRLIDAVSDNDKERIQSFFGQDTVFNNLPGGTAVGQQAIWEVFARLHDDAQAVECQIDRLDENEAGQVMTTGQVRYLIDGQWRSFSIDGAFEVAGCKIAHWR